MSYRFSICVLFLFTLGYGLTLLQLCLPTGIFMSMGHIYFLGLIQNSSCNLGILFWVTSDALANLGSLKQNSVILCCCCLSVFRCEKLGEIRTDFLLFKKFNFNRITVIILLHCTCILFVFNKCWFGKSWEH